VSIITFIRSLILVNLKHVPRLKEGMVITIEPGM
jgi:hypothetical protein